MIIILLSLSRGVGAWGGIQNLSLPNLRSPQKLPLPPPSTLLTAEPLWLFYARSTMTNSWLYCDIYFFKHFLKNTKLFFICFFLAHLDQKSMIGILITFRLLSIICKLLIYEFLSNKPKRQMYSSLIGWFTSFWCMFCLEIQQGC